MHPAPSVIVFTVLSGLGFGLLAMLGLGLAEPTGLAAFLHWGLGYALATGGLLASTLHLGNPQRALRAFTQWRTSWLSREAWGAVATLVTLAPAAMADIGWLPHLPGLGIAGAALSAATIHATAMIYAQLRTVPRWHHWTTPAKFFGFALAGGAILAGLGIVAAALCAALSVLLACDFRAGDRRFPATAPNLASATGLAGRGRVRSFAPPHTGPNYLLREMVHVVGRRHAARLRIIAVLAAGVVPALVLALPLPPLAAALLAAPVHLLGAFAARWLFFAEAEHVVGLYYGVGVRPA